MGFTSLGSYTHEPCTKAANPLDASEPLVAPCANLTCGFPNENSAMGARPLFPDTGVRLALLGALLSATALSGQAPAPFIRGDVTGDGTLTALDALGALSHVVGKTLPESFRAEPNGDANCDDALSSLDALIILSRVVGVDVSEFCVGYSDVTALVGTDGGTVEHPEGASVTIPSGLLTQEWRVSVQRAPSGSSTGGEFALDIARSQPGSSAALGRAAAPISRVFGLGDFELTLPLDPPAASLDDVEVGVTLPGDSVTYYAHSPSLLPGGTGVALPLYLPDGGDLSAYFSATVNIPAGTCEDLYRMIPAREDPGDGAGRIPVVFIHGWQSDLTSCGEWGLDFNPDDHGTEVFAHLNAAGAGDRFQYWRYTYPTYESIDLAGERLAGFIAGSFAGRTDVVLVGHSMGGLVARSAIALHGAEAHIDRLITLGTPHRGSPQADPSFWRTNASARTPLEGLIPFGLAPEWAALFVAPWRLGTRGAKDLRPSSVIVEALDESEEPLGHYHTFGGDLSDTGLDPCGHGFWKCRGYRIANRAYQRAGIPDSDAIVPRTSSLLDETSQYPGYGAGYDHLEMLRGGYAGNDFLRSDPLLGKVAELIVGYTKRVTVHGGDDQFVLHGIVLGSVLTLPSVLLRDVANNPVGGASVTFAVASGGGWVEDAVTSTNASGIATLGRWTPPLGRGPYAVTATVSGEGIAGNPVTFTAHSGGLVNGHTRCELTSAGAAYCWGDNTNGQIGDGTTADRATPTPVTGGHTFASLAEGRADHACGLTATGRAYCWGANTYGQLGDGSTSDRSAPVLVGGGLTLAELWLSVTATCGLDAAGALYCWGWEGYGLFGDGEQGGIHTLPTAVDAGGVTFTDVAVGAEHACAVAVGGTMYCWGNGLSGRLGLDEGIVVPTRTKPTAIQDGRSYSSVTAGRQHTCALTITGSALCWGSGANGQLGVGALGHCQGPCAVVGGLTFATITAGGSSTCALTTHGQAYCWGYNGFGQLGDGTTAQRTSPTAVEGGIVFTTLSVRGGRFVPQSGGGGPTGCGRTPAGQPFCWGNNDLGQVGDGTFATVRYVPTPVNWVEGLPGEAVSIVVSAGNNQSAPAGTAVAVNPSVVVRNYAGEPIEGVTVVFAIVSGGGSVTGASESTNAMGVATLASWMLGPTQGVNTLSATVGDLAPLVFSARGDDGAFRALIGITAGSSHTCGTAGGGVAYCWGANFLSDQSGGMLGDGTKTDRHTPTAVAGGLTFRGLAASVWHTCGVTNSGAGYCWGENRFSGQLGDGTRVDRLTPAAVAGGLTFQALQLGQYHTCAVTPSGGAHCWGSNAYGQLGDGTLTDRSTPVVVATGLAFQSVAAAGGHTCGLTAGGAAYCWGKNGVGQLGDGSRTQRLTPSAVTGGLAFESLSSGSSHSCGVAQGGVAYCWGFDHLGRLGDGNGTGSVRSNPRAVVGGLTYASVTAGGAHTCALTAEGAAYCWGRNRKGQLGDGSTADRWTPVAVVGGLTFELLVAGGAHTCGVTSGGVTYCWGNNNAGQLGDGTVIPRPTPVSVRTPFVGG